MTRSYLKAFGKLYEIYNMSNNLPMIGIYEFIECVKCAPTRNRFQTNSFFIKSKFYETLLKFENGPRIHPVDGIIILTGI